MQHGVVAGFRTSNSVNGTFRKTHQLTPAEVAEGWVCVKRDGSKVPFDCAKISKALHKCFNHSNPLADHALHSDGVDHLDKLVMDIVKGVVNSIQAEHKQTVDVEYVQRLIIQQLWSKGLFDSAEHYSAYRENRRKLREAKPISPEVVARIKEDQKQFKNPLQCYQFYSKFSRWRENDKRRETWRETVYDRVIPWLQNVPGVAGKLSEDTWKELADSMYSLDVSPAMRVVQMAGPALDRCNVGVFNCAYHPIESISGFCELLYILMQGTGNGFSVEVDYVSQLPRIAKQKGGTPVTIVVEDSTEGWCAAYRQALELLWDGQDFVPDVSGVRKRGTRLKTKGGRASGPEPFVDLLNFARKLILSRQGKFLTDIDMHDLSCMTGKIVQVGGVRRAALISLSDLDSEPMRDAKSGNWYAHAKYRTMANNSAVYDFDEQVPVETFMTEWLALVKSKSGERGIFNRKAALRHKPARRKAAKFGCNPCAEIILRPYEFCNLSMAIARPGDTEETLTRKVRLATIFGKIQSLCTKFNYINSRWKENCDEERLLGVDITGHADCPILHDTNPDRPALLARLRDVVRTTDIELSVLFGVNESAANTTVKPGGDSAVLFDCASGVSPRYAPYYMRWVRESIGSPIAKFLQDSGVMHAPAPEAAERLLVFGFPTKAPENSKKRNDSSAKRQFFNWLDWKRNWAEHSVSATVYVEEHEWPELGGLVYKHIDEITGLSFLPKDNGTYTYPPHEEITQAQYEELMKTFPDLNWAKLSDYESEDMTESSGTFACVGDKC